DVRLGEALHRSGAHCLACYELYRLGRRADALLQAARPITDVLPWLETELRANRAELAAFVRVVSAMGAQVRANVRARKLHRAEARVDPAIAALLEKAVGPSAHAGPYLSSVAVALLRTTLRSYEDAVTSEDLGEYQTAYACARRAGALLQLAAAKRDSELRQELAALRMALPSVEPPPRLARPASLEISIGRVVAVAERMGASSGDENELDDAIAKVERLLDDVVSSYSEGVPALSARLAATLYLRAYEPLRSELSDSDQLLEEQLSELLGVELRRSINDAAPLERVTELSAQARELLRSARARAAPGR
ncbi:MAG: hypothetical protein ACRDKZ_04930, partial [Actinomycetota bacterium]